MRAFPPGDSRVRGVWRAARGPSAAGLLLHRAAAGICVANGLWRLLVAGSLWIPQWQGLAPGASGLWHLSLWVALPYGEGFRRRDAIFNADFHWPIAAALAVFSLCRRSAWWFAPVFAPAALIFLGTIFMAPDATFYGSLPMQVSLLLPFGIAGAAVLRLEAPMTVPLIHDRAERT